MIVDLVGGAVLVVDLEDQEEEALDLEVDVEVVEGLVEELEEVLVAEVV